MSFKDLYNFLELLQKNNSKEWMDAHRNEYHAVRDFFISWLEDMNAKLEKIDPNYFNTPGKKSINRINNNLMFHPDKPIYKDNFAAGLDQVSKQGDFYLEFGVSETYVGGGYWHPSSKVLKSIREAIDYNGEEFLAIINKQSFKKTFGNLVIDKPLKTAPRGYAKDHMHIDLLRRTSFAAIHHFNREEVFTSNFKEKLCEVYLELLPFRRYLNQAITV